MKYKYLHEQEDFDERAQFWAREIERHGTSWAAQLLAMVEEDIFEAHHKIKKKVEKKPHKMDKYSKAFSILQTIGQHINEDHRAESTQASHISDSSVNAPMDELSSILDSPGYTSPRVKIAKGEARPRKKCSGCKTYCNPCKKELKRRKSL